MNQFLRQFKYVPLMLTGAIAIAGIGVGIATQHASSRATTQSSVKSTDQVTAGSTQVADAAAIAALADHLKKIGAKMYGAYWCPHCAHQKEMFGAAFRSINYIECDPQGKNAKPKLCSAAKITGYPTWEVNGKQLVGVQSLEDLAKASNYKGPNSF